MNMTLRLAERGDDGFGGSGGSRPLLIDLANNRWRSNFSCLQLPVRLRRYCSKFQAGA
jgi:hypothetical protein